MGHFQVIRGHDEVIQGHDEVIWGWIYLVNEEQHNSFLQIQSILLQCWRFHHFRHKWSLQILHLWFRFQWFHQANELLKYLEKFSSISEDLIGQKTCQRLLQLCCAPTPPKILISIIVSMKISMKIQWKFQWKF